VSSGVRRTVSELVRDHSRRTSDFASSSRIYVVARGCCRRMASGFVTASRQAKSP
jgi:hypothetical protein